MSVMCAYGNCAEMISPKSTFKLTVTTSSHGTVTNRQSFCCYEHAILWLQKRDNTLNEHVWPSRLSTDK